MPYSVVAIHSRGSLVEFAELFVQQGMKEYLAMAQMFDRVYSTANLVGLRKNMEDCKAHLRSQKIC